MPLVSFPSLSALVAAKSKALQNFLFALTIFSSACLLFLVQPIISKLILPWFGGSAAVWITCMLFFQCGLLAGYLYAYRIARALATPRQIVLHAVLLLLGLAALPILPNPKWEPAPGEDPTWRVFALLATSIGLPYILLSATSPLLQSWYAGAWREALPYRYFALSNAGSLAALIAFPIFIEPHLTGHRQALIWSTAFAIFALLCIATAILIHRRMQGGGALLEKISNPESFSVRQRLLWLALAACASALLLVVTNLLTANIAPMPLLWVLPLTIYLLTFVICFENDRWYNRFFFLPLVLPALVCLAAFTGPLTNQTIALSVPLLCVALFVCCMACHGELARMKPTPSGLTAFYVYIAAGGALGGVFVALLAPHIFRAMYEYPIVFVCCPLVLLTALWPDRATRIEGRFSVALWLAALAGTMALAGYVSRETFRNVRSATLLARNFYGALRVDDSMDENRQIRELSHGTITHGIQFRNPLLRHKPTTYYAPDSGAGLTWRALASKGPLRMGVVGLGAGTLAAYGRADDTLRFYEINPLVVEIANREFTFLSDSAAHIDIILGDARFSLAREPSQHFDILVIDAFSGDAIPIHLLTREAFEIYWRHLKPDGVLALHVSNHYLNLAPIVLLAAKQLGKQAWKVENGDDDEETYSSTYVLMTNNSNFLNNPLIAPELSKIDLPPHLEPWTDDFNNLWQVLVFK